MGKSSCILVCNKGSRYQVKEFSILCMGKRKPLGSLNSFHSYSPQLSGATPVSLFTLLLAFPQLLSNHRGGWQHPMDHSFGGLSFTFGSQRSLIAVTFLIY